MTLFVSKKKHKYYHEKYQYAAVYKTKDGRWAARFNQQIAYGNIKPEKITFGDDVILPEEWIGDFCQTVCPVYDKSYYIQTKNGYRPIFGNYIPDIFTIKKNGVLKWRGLFGQGDENWRDSIVETQIHNPDLQKALDVVCNLSAA